MRGLLSDYYVSWTAFLALSSLIERRCSAAPVGEDRIRDAGTGCRCSSSAGLAEGTATVIANVLFCVLPGWAVVIASVFTAAVAVTVTQHGVLGVRLLRPTPQPPRPGAP